jgi:hypothetical protein
VSQQRRRERRRPTINVFPVTAAAYFHTLSFRRFVVTVDVSPPSASKALRQRHAHHPRSRSTHTRAHVPCRMWDLGPRSLVLELVLCFHARLPWTELRCPPLLRLHAQCPWTALRPPPGCASMLESHARDSGLVGTHPGHTRGMASIADRMASRPRGSLSWLLLHASRPCPWSWVSHVSVPRV